MNVKVIDAASGGLSYTDIAWDNLQFRNAAMPANRAAGDGSRAVQGAPAVMTTAVASGNIDLGTLLSGIENTVAALLASPKVSAGTPDVSSGNASGVPVGNALPTDPYFSLQWHLRQTVGGLYDLNVTDVWDMGYTGAGNTVLVIDDGFDYTHSDISPNYLTGYDFDFDPTTGVNDAYDAFGNSASDNHGTAVMGLIGAARDGSGAVGVSYASALLGYRVNGYISDLWLANIRDAIHYGWSNGSAEVINISQGMANYAPTVFGGYLDQSLVGAIRTSIGEAVDSGRGGLGTLIAKSAGNSRAGNVYNYDVNADMWSNDTRQVVVAAVDQDGTVSSYSSYGAAILISAFGTPGDIVTTDRTGGAGYAGGDFTYFNGTSAAAPEIAGVISLILDANANLGWRDVQNILALSARHVGSAIDGSTTDGIERTPWLWNGAESGNIWNGGGAHFSNDYGYGLVDAAAAVRMAETWLLDQAAQTSANQASTFQDGLNSTVVIPDGNTTGTTFNIVESDSIWVERVTLTVTFSTTYIGDVEIYLISPDGVRNELIRDVLQGDGSGAYANDFNGTWTFESQAFRGELSNGTWRVQIVDDASGDTLTVSDIDLRTYGRAYSNNDRWVFTNEFSDYDNVAGHSTNLSDANGGTDTLNAAAVTSGVTLNLGAGTGTVDGVAVTIHNFENAIGGVGNDRLTGTTGANKLWGGRGNDAVSGGSGNDSLTGGSGTDTLTGGAGKDTLSGGGSADRFVFNATLSATTNVDTIKDFVHGSDKIALDNAVMAGLGLTTGALSSAKFYAHAGATHGHDSSDRIVYDTTTGKLYYDSNGSASGGVTQIAILTTHPAINASDFLIV